MPYLITHAGWNDSFLLKVTILDVTELYHTWPPIQIDWVMYTV